jgi:hypothetical protein
MAVTLRIEVVGPDHPAGRKKAHLRPVEENFAAKVVIAMERLRIQRRARFARRKLS